MKFRLHKNDNHLRFEVWDQDSGSGDDIIGGGDLTFERDLWLIDKPHTKVRLLGRTKKGGKGLYPVGHVFFTIRFVPDVDPGAPIMANEPMSGGFAQPGSPVKSRVSQAGQLRFSKMYANLKDGTEGGGLFGIGVSSKIDPYLKIYLVGQNGRKGVKPIGVTENCDDGGAHPKWKKIFSKVKIDLQHQKALVEIWDDDTSGDDFLGIGYMVFKRDQWVNQQQVQVTMQGAPKSKKAGKIIGTVYFTVRYNPDETYA